MGVVINPDLEIPDRELRFSASRSSGPGGQHVNKTSTRMTLEFDVAGSDSLSESARGRILGRLSSRIDRAGVLRMHCQKHRSQAANRRELILRFATVLGEALRHRRPRKKTRPSRGAVERRLEQKKRRARIKRQRTGGREVED